jgi:hypothetical protein
VGVLEKRTAGNGQAQHAAAAGSKAMIKAWVLVAVVFLAAGGVCFAQTAPSAGPPAEPPVAEASGPRAWQSLSPQQQQLLHGFQDKWNSLPPERQQSLAKGSQRWLSMTPEQRSSAQQRFQQWRSLPPEQRQQLRQRWQQFKSLPPEQQQRVREQFRRFHQMPLEQRQELRKQWRQMSPEQRRRWIQRPPPIPHRNPR